MATKKKRTWGNWWTALKRLFIILVVLQFLYILILKWVDPPLTVTQAVSFLSGDGLKRDYVSLDHISAAARLAVIASEDQLFPDHDGFDFKSIEKAMKHNQKSRSLRGASTISQQVAKNVFLWQQRSYIRKGLEVYFTFMIERVWGKRRILEVYLNVSEMGKGIYGIEAASRVYFKKPASGLNRYESAKIAACLPNPKKFTVKPVSRHVAIRSEWILRQMGNLQSDPDIQELLQ